MERNDGFCHPVDGEEDGVYQLDLMQNVQLTPTNESGNVIACPGLIDGKCRGQFTCYRQVEFPDITIITKD